MSSPWRKKKNYSEEDAATAPKNPAKKNAFRRPFCPVTCNLPTRMPQQIFTKLCRNNRNSEDENYCNQVCRGKKLPAGLQFVEPVTFINEDHAMSQYKPGKCLLCEKQKNVISIIGKLTCATCSPVITAARNTPDLLVRALLEEQKQEWLDLNFTRDRGKSEFDEIPLLLTEVSKLNHLCDGYRADLDDKDRELENMRLELQTAKHLLQELQSSEIQEINYLTATSDTGTVGRDSAVLDLALDILDGKITGLGSERLRALRN